MHAPFQTPPSRPILLAWLFAAASFALVLLWFREADTDIWHQLAIGAETLHLGRVPDADIFSFLPTLNPVVHHEWGAGLWCLLLLKLAGPAGLILWKTAAGLGTLAAALFAARRAGASHGTLLALAPLAALCVLPGFVPVVRAHVFTYLGFAILLALIGIVRERRVWWPVAATAALVLVWMNCHGGFVAGLGMIGIFWLGSFHDRAAFKILFAMGAAGTAVTFVNPWGWRYWPHHLEALRHARPAIAEWGPIALEGFNPFVGYWFLLPVAAAVLAFGWRRVEHHDWPMLAMFALTLLLPWSAKRHLPFSGIMMAAALAPYAEAIALQIRAHVSRSAARPATLLAAGYGAVLLIAVVSILPSVRLRVRAPIGLFPVREADILDRAGISGNLATPFNWGAYCMWRLHPRIKVSMDSRYEASYSSQTFDMNQAFYARGANWRNILDDYKIDFIVLDLSGGGLRETDLVPLGFRTVYKNEGTSELLIHESHMEEFLRAMARVDLETMPTAEPFDPHIPDRWFVARP